MDSRLYITYTSYLFVDEHGFFPKGVFSSIRFLYIFVKLNICSSIRKQLIIMNFFFAFFFFAFFSFFFFINYTFIGNFMSSKLSFCVRLYRVTGRKPANNCCADNRNNTLIKKQSINQSISCWIP